MASISVTLTSPLLSSFPSHHHHRLLPPLATTHRKRSPFTVKMVNRAEPPVQQQPATTDFKLVGFKNFKRTNPKSDYFPVHRFHHVEFYCPDAVSASSRFSHALGLPTTHRSDLSTGNTAHASYLLCSKTHQLRLLFTSAAYSPELSDPSSAAIPTFSGEIHRKFTASHGLNVRAVGLQVSSAAEAYDIAVSQGAELYSPPIVLSDGKTTIAEVKMFGDVVLRFVSCPEDTQDAFFLPGFEFNDRHPDLDYGIMSLDHVAANVPELGPVVDYLHKITGFHEFVEFTAEEVGTAESGQNSYVLANNDENILFPLTEPVHGTKRKSQVQWYLDHNEGPGVHHLAMTTGDIFETLREMKRRTGAGGFDFMPPPLFTYYDDLKGRAGDVLSDEQIDACKELGILVDRDDQGTLLQIFSKPVGDRPTIIVEIIQRLGCMHEDEQGKIYQKGACGGFGKGNVTELFKSVEKFERMIEAKQVHPATA